MNIKLLFEIDWIFCKRAEAKAKCEKLGFCSGSIGAFNYQVDR